MSVPLFTALKASYEPNDKAKKLLLKHDYVLVNGLSNHNQKVFYNPKTHKVLFSISGTHSLEDVGTDVYLAAGKLKHTKRFQQAKAVFKEIEKQLPHNTGINVVGHSLGGAIAQYITSNPKHKVYTYDKGATIGQNHKANETAYRTAGDVVSLLASKQDNIKTLERKVANLRGAVTQEQKPTFFKSHNLYNLKHSNIFVSDEPEHARPVYNPHEGDSVEFQNYSLND